jgi:hypothetical protein
VRLDSRATSVGTGWLRASDPYSIPQTRSQCYLPWWEPVWVAVCKTVGIAYVGSNPTPATFKINRP